MSLQDQNDVQLEMLSVQELQDLKVDIDNAIRAAIRGRADFKAKQAGTVAVEPVKVDLERERDAWIAAKRQTKPLAAS